MGRQRVVMLGPDPPDAFRHLGDLGPQRLGLTPDRGHRAFQTQHPLHIVAKLQRAFHFAVQIPHSCLHPVDLFAGRAQPLRLTLRLRQPLAQGLQSFHLLLDRHAALAQGVQLGRALHDRSPAAEAAPPPPRHGPRGLRAWR